MLKNPEFTDKLRSLGLRPTRQRLKICEVLFSPEKTFHFTIKDLTKIIEQKLSEKISLATVYNTVHALLTVIKVILTPMLQNIIIFLMKIQMS